MPEQLPDPLLHGLVEPVVGECAVDQDRAQGTLRIPVGPVAPTNAPSALSYFSRSCNFSGSCTVDRGLLGADGRVRGDDRLDLDRGGPGRTVLVPLVQRLRAVMSPREVVARMSSSVVPSFLRALLTRP